MRIVNNDDGSRSVILERKTCTTCYGSKMRQNYVRCPHDGRRQNGKACGDCGSKRKDHSQVRRPDTICDRCDENGTVPESTSDYVPRDWWSTVFELRVVSNQPNREATFMENYLGFGYIYTVQDYGRTRPYSDEEVIADVRKGQTTPQLSQLLLNSRANDSDTLVLTPYIEIIRRADGYNVRAHR